MSAETLLNVVRNNELRDLLVYLGSENDENVNTKGDQGWTLLHYAVINGNAHMVTVLLKNGADPTLVNNEGDTPLHVASRKGCMEIVNVLLKHASVCGINYVNNKTTLHGDTPLHIAAKNGFTDIIKSLLRHGAIYNIKNNANRTPLDLSKAYTVTKILNLIQESFEGAQKGDVGIVDTLKAANLDEFSAILRARNCKNQPLIQEAMTYGHHKLTAKLLEISVDIDSQLTKNEPLTAPGILPKVTVSSIDAKDKLKDLKSAAETQLRVSSMYVNELRSMSKPYGSDKNGCPWETVEKGSYLLENTLGLIDLYKKYMGGKIEDANLKLVNDTLVYLQFDRSHIGSNYTQEAFGEVEHFSSTGRGTVYYNMLHSDLNKDVRLFIDIVEKNLDNPVRRFLETITQKLKIFF